MFRVCIIGLAALALAAGPGAARLDAQCPGGVCPPGFGQLPAQGYPIYPSQQPPIIVEQRQSTYPGFGGFPGNGGFPPYAGGYEGGGPRWYTDVVRDPWGRTFFVLSAAQVDALRGYRGYPAPAGFPVVPFPGGPPVGNGPVVVRGY